MYTTNNFCKSLIQSIINFMNENKVKVLPLDFLANRNDYGSCDAARAFYEHGHRYFTIENGELILHCVLDNLGKEFVGKKTRYIVSETRWPWPDREHYCYHTTDLVNLVRIAYDTIGSSHFDGRGVDDWDYSKIDELEAEYEARRNEVA